MLDYTYEVVQDLVANDGDHLEGLRGGDAIDEEVPVQADELCCGCQLECLHSTRCKKLTCLELRRLYSSCVMKPFSALIFKVV
jgi:hypothetical protein